jgi:hypothetical protein
VCASAPVALRQKEPRLIEVSAWIKTDRLCMLQLDALDEKGERLEACYFIHKAPVSIGTDDWRVIRQVFRPRRAVESVRLQLCARGVNGYTLDDTGYILFICANSDKHEDREEIIKVCPACKQENMNRRDTPFIRLHTIGPKRVQGKLAMEYVTRISEKCNFCKYNERLSIHLQMVQPCRLRINLPKKIT